MWTAPSSTPQSCISRPGRCWREKSFNFTRADFAATFGRRNPEIIRQLLQTPLTDAEVAHIGDRKEILYREAAQEGVTLLPGARRLLEGLQPAGFCQAVGSSAPRANLDLILRITETARFFTVLVSMEDTERGKPDPQVFQVAAEKLGVPPERCIVIEDAVAGVQAAKAAGMKCLAVSIGGHHSADALKNAGADRVVRTLEEVSAEAVRQLL